MSQRFSLKHLTLAVLAFALLLSAATPVLAARDSDAERKSKNGKAEGSIDGVSVVVEFGRPQVRGRDLWGALVPFDQVWRTGADEATAITFDADVNVEGKHLAAGTYSLFTIPSKDHWTVIFNTVAEQWGAYEHAADKDALRVTVKPQAHEHVEAMDIVIEGSTVTLHWGEVAVPFSVAKAE